MSHRVRRAVLIAITLISALLLSVPLAFSDTIQPKAAVARLFQEPLQKDWFAPSFLAQVPVSKVATLVAEMKQKFGALKDISAKGASLVITLEKGEVDARVTLDDSGRIATLLFQPPTPTTGSLADQVKAITDLPGKTAVLITTNGKDVVADDADEALAVGSAAKLAILAALDDAVSAHRLAWDQVVRLTPKWQTLPTSTLLNWPAGTPVTIATLRNLMISQSDNMAADALINLVGRQHIEGFAPHDTPFPTTSELFKLRVKPDMQALWEKADVAGKRKILASLDLDTLPQVTDLPDKAGVAEWFMTARELCGLLDRVAASPAFVINPGLATRSDWRQVAYKGGSDSGVLNLSTRVVAADGTTHCISVTWDNDKASLDKLVEPYRGILRLLKGG
jgi:beta-lactamase class A